MPIFRKQAPKECPKAETLGFIKAAKKFDSVSLGLSTFAKYTGFDKTNKQTNKTVSVIFIKDVWVEIYQSALLIWQVS